MINLQCMFLHTGSVYIYIYIRIYTYLFSMIQNIVIQNLYFSWVYLTIYLDCFPYPGCQNFSRMVFQGSFRVPLRTNLAYFPVSP